MIYYNMPMDEYHASDAVSNSKAKVFKEYGAQRFYRQYIAKDLPGEDSPALAFGRAFDDMLFAPPSVFDAAYVRKPEAMNFATKEGKAWRDENADKTIVSDNDWTIMMEMAKAIADNPIAASLLSSGTAQVSIRAELPEFGIVAQSRPDWLRMEPTPGICAGPCIVDLKTTADLNSFDPIKWGYHMQIALGQALLAREGIMADAFLLVVEKTRSPRCKVISLPELALAAGWNRFYRIAMQIGGRLRSGDWTETQEAVEVANIKPWQLKELEMEACI